jgi:SEC-C motif-containing protein
MTNAPGKAPSKACAIDICPCRIRESKPLAYAACCRPLIEGLGAAESVDAGSVSAAYGVRAPNAEALMRSRYTAYALGGRNPSLAPAMLAYLQRTWHPDFLPADLSVAQTNWTGLKVMSAKNHCDQATVAFEAFYKEGGKTEKMAETSSFVKHQGAWVYTQGA